MFRRILIRLGLIPSAECVHEQAEKTAELAAETNARWAEWREIQERWGRDDGMTRM